MNIAVKKTSRKVLFLQQNFVGGILISLSAATAKADIKFQSSLTKVYSNSMASERSLQESKTNMVKIMFGCSQTLLLCVPAWNNPSLWRTAQQRDKAKDHQSN